MTTC